VSCGLLKYFFPFLPLLRPLFPIGQSHLPHLQAYINPLTPNDPYRGHNSPLTSKRCILYIYSTNIGTEYFKRGTYSPFFSLQNAICFIIVTYMVPVSFTFYIQGVLELKKNSGAKRLTIVLPDTVHTLGYHRVYIRGICLIKTFV